MATVSEAYEDLLGFIESTEQEVLSNLNTALDEYLEAWKLEKQARLEYHNTVDVATLNTHHPAHDGVPSSNEGLRKLNAENYYLDIVKELHEAKTSLKEKEVALEKAKAGLRRLDTLVAASTLTALASREIR